MEGVRPRYHRTLHRRIPRIYAKPFTSTGFTQTWTIDGLLSYDFTALLPVEEQPVPGYSKSPKDFVRK